MERTAAQQQALREGANGAEAEEVLSALRESSGEGPLVMAVDDDPAIIQMVRAVLGQCGCQPLVTESPKVALDLLRYKTPDLILLDINMPEIDGSEFFARIRELPHTKKTPVVFMTGLISPEEEQDYNLGTPERSRYLGKPFTAEKLLAVIEALTRKG